MEEEELMKLVKLYFWGACPRFSYKVYPRQPFCHHPSKSPFTVLTHTLALTSLNLTLLQYKASRCLPLVWFLISPSAQRPAVRKKPLHGTKLRSEPTSKRLTKGRSAPREKPKSVTRK